MIQSNWGSCFQKDSIDCIISNPPYIDKDDAHLGDLEYEPLSALVSKLHGLEAFEIISQQAKKLLKKGGLILFEHGFDQSEDVENIIYKNDLKLILDRKASPKGYHVSSDGQISFSDDETKLYFGLALPEIYQDTLLLKEEIVDVEVWTYDEPRLYTIQEMQLNNDKKKSFKSVYNFDNEKVVQIANKDFPNAIISEHGNGEYALISNPQPYQLSSQWTALFSKNDLAVKNIKNGDSEIVIKGNPSLARLSPQGYYAFGYNQVDSTWYTHNLKKSKYTELTRGKIFYNELSDYPNYPSSYGIAGWSKNDKTIFIYDRYDIWEFDPDTGNSKRLSLIHI